MERGTEGPHSRGAVSALQTNGSAWQGVLFSPSAVYFPVKVVVQVFAFSDSSSMCWPRALSSLPDRPAQMFVLARQRGREHMSGRGQGCFFRQQRQITLAGGLPSKRQPVCAQINQHFSAGQGESRTGQRGRAAGTWWWHTAVGQCGGTSVSIQALWVLQLLKVPDQSPDLRLQLCLKIWGEGLCDVLILCL